MKNLTLDELAQIALDACKNKMEQSRTSIIGAGKLGAVENVKAAIRIFKIEDSIADKMIKEAEELLPEGSYLFTGISVNTPDGNRFLSIFDYIAYLKTKK